MNCCARRCWTGMGERWNSWRSGSVVVTRFTNAIARPLFPLFAAFFRAVAKRGLLQLMVEQGDVVLASASKQLPLETILKGGKSNSFLPCALRRIRTSSL